MIIYGSPFFPKALRPGINNIIDWGVTGRASNTLGISIAWTVSEPIGFGGTIFRWGSNGSIYGGWGTEGTTSGNSTGNLQFVFTDDSVTLGSVSNYNDGTITVNQFTCKADLKYTAIQKACINILKQTGKAGQTYKLDIIKNGQLEFTIRSILWGTETTFVEGQPNYQLIDRQFDDSSISFY